MTTQTAPASAPAGPISPPDRSVHLYCCDPNLALCGADLSRGLEHPDAPAHAACPLCEVIDNLDTACGPDCADWA